MAAMPATSGATIAGSRTLATITEPFTEASPAPTMTAPIRPPKRACEELDGRPSSQVRRFQMMAPTKPARMIGAVTSASSKKPPEMVLATSVERTRADEVEHRGQDDGSSRLQRTGRDGTGHRVGTVVEAVREVEDEGHEDDDDHDEQHCHDGPYLERVARWLNTPGARR